VHTVMTRCSPPILRRGLASLCERSPCTLTLRKAGVQAGGYIRLTQKRGNPIELMARKTRPCSARYGFSAPFALCQAAANILTNRRYPLWENPIQTFLRDSRSRDSPPNPQK